MGGGGGNKFSIEHASENFISVTTLTSVHCHKSFCSSAYHNDTSHCLGLPATTNRPD